MGRVRKDVTGIRVGKVVAKQNTGTLDRNSSVYIWACDCGKEFTDSLLRVKARTLSGCEDCRSKAVSDNCKVHGMSGTKEWISWWGARDRCFNENHPHYKNYGGRGIRMCDEWRDDFMTFYEYLGPMPVDGNKYTLDRINNNGNYEPGNVRWVTFIVQANNRRPRLSSAGIKCVRWETTNGYKYAIASWRDCNGVVCTERFSVKKLGEEEALRLAFECRKRHEDEYVLDFQ